MTVPTAGAAAERGTALAEPGGDRRPQSRVERRTSGTAVAAAGHGWHESPGSPPQFAPVRPPGQQPKPPLRLRDVLPPDCKTDWPG